jgi:hypothetical protein
VVVVVILRQTRGSGERWCGSRCGQERLGGSRRTRKLDSGAGRAGVWLSRGALHVQRLGGWAAGQAGEGRQADGWVRASESCMGV